MEATEVDLAFVCHTDTVPYAAIWTDAMSDEVAPFVQAGFSGFYVGSLFIQWWSWLWK